MTTARIPVPHKAVAAFCQRWGITELALFGSVLRDDFRPESDVDVLVRFAPDHQWTFLDMAEMEAELKAVFGRPVDLVEWESVEESPNYIRRRAILDSVESVYAGG